MTQRATGSPNPFDVTPPAGGGRHLARAGPHPAHLAAPHHGRGRFTTVELPAALEQPSQFSAAEFERLTRGNAESLGLLGDSKV